MNSARRCVCIPFEGTNFQACAMFRSSWVLASCAMHRTNGPSTRPRYTIHRHMSIVRACCDARLNLRSTPRALLQCMLIMLRLIVSRFDARRVVIFVPRESSVSNPRLRPKLNNRPSGSHLSSWGLLCILPSRMPSQHRALIMGSQQASHFASIVRCVPYAWHPIAKCMRISTAGDRPKSHHKLH